MSCYQYTPLLGDNNGEPRNILCKEYYFAGYTNTEIRTLLESQHDIILSVRHLRRILCNMGLYRRKHRNLRIITSAVQMELCGSGSNLGYRGLQRRLLSKYGLNAPRDLVSDIQCCFDPEGVLSRRKHRLRRRTYINDGPNYFVHIDGFDKLKPYGFAIHGGIDGLSRRVLWLRVGPSNKKPEIVATFFVDYLKEIKGVPRRIRYDAGTENTLIEDIQVSFRMDHSDDMAGPNSVIMGPFPSNQLIQQELDYQMVDWNQHRIRQSKIGETSGGKPDMMFFAPNLYGSVDYKTSVSLNDLEKVLEEFCQSSHLKGCEANFAVRCETLMNSHNKTNPSNHHEALELYAWLMRFI